MSTWLVFWLIVFVITMWAVIAILYGFKNKIDSIGFAVTPSDLKAVGERVSVAHERMDQLETDARQLRRLYETLSLRYQALSAEIDLHKSGE